MDDITKARKRLEKVLNELSTESIDDILGKTDPGVLDHLRCLREKQCYPLMRDTCTFRRGLSSEKMVSSAYTRGDMGAAGRFYAKTYMSIPGKLASMRFAVRNKHSVILDIATLIDTDHTEFDLDYFLSATHRELKDAVKLVSYFRAGYAELYEQGTPHIAS